MLIKFLSVSCILLKSPVLGRMHGKKILAVTVHRLASLLHELHRVASHVAVM